MSKGSVRRPQRVSREEMERRWEETFGGGKEAEKVRRIGNFVVRVGSMPSMRSRVRSRGQVTIVGAVPDATGHP